MQISRSELMHIFHQCLFLLMTSMVFVFNFQTQTIMGISGNLWVNLCILFFIIWWSLHVLKSGHLMWNPIYTFACLFLFISFVSYLYSFAPDDTFDKVKTLILVAWMSISIYQYIVLSGDLDFVLKVYAFSGTLMALYIILKSDFMNGARLGNVIGDANLVGITLALTSTVALYLFFMQRKFIYILQFLCMGCVILLTGSRTAAVLLFSSVIVFLYTSAYLYHWRLKKIVIVTVILGAVLFATWQAIMNVPSLYDALGIRIISFFQISRGQHSINNEQSTQLRVLFAQRAFDWFIDSPVWGNGINSFLSYNNTFANGNYCFSHCNYTELLSGLGILGFISYYGIFLYSLLNICIKKNKLALKYKTLILTLVVEVLIGDIGLVVYYEKCTWILIALLAGVMQQIHGGESEDILYEQKT